MRLDPPSRQPHLLPTHPLARLIKTVALERSLKKGQIIEENQQKKKQKKNAVAAMLASLRHLNPCHIARRESVCSKRSWWKVSKTGGSVSHRRGEDPRCARQSQLSTHCSALPKRNCAILDAIDCAHHCQACLSPHDRTGILGHHTHASDVEGCPEVRHLLRNLEALEGLEPSVRCSRAASLTGPSPFALG